MEQNTGAHDYCDLLNSVFFAMGKKGKTDAADKFGRRAINLENTWEAYHFTGFIKEIFEVNHPELMNEFSSLLVDLKIGAYSEDFRKLPSAQGFTLEKARGLFKGVTDIRRTRKDRNFTERDLLLEFLIFCQKPLTTKTGATKSRVISIFYGEESNSDTAIKQNDPALVKKAQSRLSEEIKNLKKYIADSESEADYEHDPDIDDIEENADAIKSAPENRHRIERVKGEEKWLDPYNYDELPFVGRKKELDLLDKFVKDSDPFKIWAIAGPSGAGKTRLAIQWATDSRVIVDWDCRALHKEDRIKPKKWEKWFPDRPTLIIIDYMYGFKEVILKLMGRRLKPTGHKVRLLLIDHVFSTPLHNDKRWGFSGEGSSHNRNEKYFFNLKPLDLKESQDQEEIIKKIIAHRAGIDHKNNQVKVAHEYLLDIKDQSAYHPLFAALVGDAIKSGRNFEAWNRRELVNYYLSGEKRLPWENNELALTGLWASYFIAVATARRGVAYKDLIKAASNCKPRPRHFRDVKKICQKVITDDNATALAPFEPDILGESFFLKVLRFIEDSPECQVEFRQVLMAGNADTQTNDAIEFIVFIRRLTRNLLNDDQSRIEMQNLWDTLFDFMNPSDFNDAEPIKWGMTAGLIDIVDSIKDKDQFPEEKLISLLNQADPAVFYHVDDSSPLLDLVWYSMRHFELTSKLTEITPECSEEIFELFNRYTENNGETALITASYLGLNKIINALLTHGLDIAETAKNGLNALMAACCRGHTKIVKELLNVGANVNATTNKGNTALHWACDAGHTEVVRLLLDHEANFNFADKRGYTALILASINGHAEVVDLLLDNGVDIEIADNKKILRGIGCIGEAANLLFDDEWFIGPIENEGRTALVWACFEGHIDVVKLLLAKGANIDTTDSGGRTAFFVASNAGHAEVVELLLDERADIDATKHGGHTALIWASFAGHFEMAKLLLDEKANINATDYEGYTALILASMNGCVEVVKLLLDNGAKINFASKKGFTALILASMNGCVEVVKLLLSKKVDIEATDNEKKHIGFSHRLSMLEFRFSRGMDVLGPTENEEGRTALIWASYKGHVEVAKLLLDKGANIDVTDSMNCSALSVASSEGHVEMAKLLLDKEANIDSTDKNGRTALIQASLRGYVDLVKLLLDGRANIHTFDSEGFTALCAASFFGHFDVVKLLIDEEANIHSTDRIGRPILSLVAFKGHIEVAKLLLAKGANINATDNMNRTPLFWASEYNKIDIVKLLLKQKAQADIDDKNGQTALSIAIKKEHEEIVKLLVTHGAKE